MYDSDKFLSFVIVFQIVIQGCKNILVQGFPMLHAINNQLNWAIMGLSLILYIVALFKNKQRILAQAVSILLFVIITYFYTYIFFPQNFEIIQNTILRSVICCFFTFLLITKLRTFEYIYFYFNKSSYLITFCGVLYGIIVNIIGHSTTSEWSSYSMTVSNVLLISVMWQLNAYFDEKNLKAFMSSVIGMFIIFVYGSRNPFLAILTFVFIKIFFNSDRSHNNVNLLPKLILTIIVVFSVIFYKELLSLIASILESLNLGSRSLYYLLNADTEDFSTGRSDIHDKLWRFVFEDPFVGFGIGGDEVVVKELAHSFYLSIFITYGFIGGLCVLCYVFLLSIKGFKKTVGLDKKILTIYACLVFPRTFTGGDIWINDFFWIFIGLVISSLYNRNNVSHFKI